MSHEPSNLVITCHPSPLPAFFRKCYPIPNWSCVNCVWDTCMSNEKSRGKLKLTKTLSIIPTFQLCLLKRGMAWKPMQWLTMKKFPLMIRDTVKVTTIGKNKYYSLHWVLILTELKDLGEMMTPKIEFAPVISLRNNNNYNCWGNDSLLYRLILLVLDMWVCV